MPAGHRVLRRPGPHQGRAGGGEWPAGRGQHPPDVFGAEASRVISRLDMQELLECWLTSTRISQQQLERSLDASHDLSCLPPPPAGHLQPPEETSDLCFTFYSDLTIFC